MVWELRAHRRFRKDLDKLQTEDRERVLDGLRGLAAVLDEVDSLDPRRVAASGSLEPVPDLRPLKGTGIPGSYRLRVGPWRVAVALLPDEEIVLVTVLDRRDSSTYDTLADLHARRFQDR